MMLKRLMLHDANYPMNMSMLEREALIERRFQDTMSLEAFEKKNGIESTRTSASCSVHQDGLLICPNGTDAVTGRWKRVLQKDARRGFGWIGGAHPKMGLLSLLRKSRKATASEACGALNFLVVLVCYH